MTPDVAAQADQITQVIAAVAAVGTAVLGVVVMQKSYLWFRDVADVGWSGGAVVCPECEESYDDDGPNAAMIGESGVCVSCHFGGVYGDDEDIGTEYYVEGSDLEDADWVRCDGCGDAFHDGMDSWVQLTEYHFACPSCGHVQEADSGEFG